jgi:hypothetical protein
LKITRINESITRSLLLQQLYEHFIKKKKDKFLWRFFVYFATFLVQNLPAHRRKTEKQRNSHRESCKDKVFLKEQGVFVKQKCPYEWQISLAAMYIR